MSTHIPKPVILFRLVIPPSISVMGVILQLISHFLEEGRWCQSSDQISAYRAKFYAPKT